MRIESGRFRVDYSSNDRFVQVLLLDAKLQGGVKAVGTFVEKKFKPERNTAFDMADLITIHDLLNTLMTKIQW